MPFKKAIATPLFAAVIATTSPFAADPAPDAMSFTNRLVDSQSPYLLQHAHNPVDWYPWGDEAFEKAKAENKPVLISIGYSTCHWCHVMNRESFSDPEIAKYLNENFICIKVDREERPDVDGVYMSFVQQLTGSGGWPLNVWLTPERKPFFGGTYFPPEARPYTRQPGFPDLLSRIHDLWTNKNEEILVQSQSYVETLNSVGKKTAGSPDELSIDLFSQAIDSFSQTFDPHSGGFGGAPKFPSPANLSFLLKASTLKELPEAKRTRSLEMATRTLEAIARGGIRDHLAGGFHRYSVDGDWAIPHFEKMLYDQGLLVNAYLDAWVLTKNETFKTAAEETLAYLSRDMKNAAGAFYSAEDAESYETHEKKEKREGAFYVFATTEIDALFDEKKAAFAKSYYGMSEHGNAPQIAATEELEGYNTPRIQQTIEDLSQQYELNSDEAVSWIREINTKLLNARNAKPRPFLDDKVIVSWNGLVISAFARAAQVLQNPNYAAEAQGAADFIKAKLYNSDTQTLDRLYRGAPSGVEAFADDYAYLIAGLLDLYEANANHENLRWADTLQQTLNAKFYDEQVGGFYEARATEDIVFDRSKSAFDGAMPAVSSIAAKNLARLAQMLDKADYQEKATQTILAFMSDLKREPRQMPALIDAATYVLNKPIQVVLAGDAVHSQLAKELHSELLPNRVILHADGAAGQKYLSKSLEFIEGVYAIGGQPTAFLCENYACQMPTNSVDVFKKQLSGLLP